MGWHQVAIVKGGAPSSHLDRPSRFPTLTQARWSNDKIVNPGLHPQSRFSHTDLDPCSPIVPRVQLRDEI